MEQKAIKLFRELIKDRPDLQSLYSISFEWDGSGGIVDWTHGEEGYEASWEDEEEMCDIIRVWRAGKDLRDAV